MSDFQIPVFAWLVGVLADWMRVALQLCYEFTKNMGFPSYGIAIIVLTICIKLILLPLAIKQIRSMKGMQEIQPKIKAVQAKYKNDKAKLNSEMQRLYRENNVSPLAGCLPLLIQMPFLVAIYYALQGFAYDPGHESFLWLDSLAQADTTYILPVLSALSTWFISYQTTPKNVQGTQKTMMYFMPLFIGYISLNFPSGLVIYWVVCNVFQMVQQTIMFHGDKKPDEKKRGVVTVDNSDKPKKKVVKKVVVKKVVKKKTDGGKAEKSVPGGKTEKTVSVKKQKANVKSPADGKEE